MAQQKREAHLHFLRRGLGLHPEGLVLKTDIFEDAFGADSMLDEAMGGSWVGMDLSLDTVRKALQRWSKKGLSGMTSDVRCLPLRTESIGHIISFSTLDHFPRREDYLQAISELHRVLAPGGRLLLTLDNPRNLLYPLLKAYVNRRGPFPLGYSPSLETAQADCEALGLRITHPPSWLIHNPRLFSTALFLLLRKYLGRHATRPVGHLLKAFSLLPVLLGEERSACWYGLAFEKPKRPNC